MGGTTEGILRGIPKESLKEIPECISEEISGESLERILEEFLIVSRE